MYLPPILPDELLDGYLGRIARFNGYQSREDLRYPLAHEARKQKPSCHPLGHFTSSVSILLKKDVEELLSEHTLWSFSSAIERKRIGEEHHIDSKAQFSTYISLHEERTNLRLCPHCIEHDMDTLWCAYWRRSHQVPGRLVCPSHKVPLLLYKGQSSFIENSPYEAIKSAAIYDNVLVSDYLTNPIIQRSVAVIDHIIKEKIILKRNLYHESIVGALKARDIDFRIIDQYLHFWGDLIRSLGSSWMQNAMPGIKKPEVTDTATVIRKIVLSPHISCTPTPVVLMAAMLFTSVEEVLSAIGIRQ